MVLEKKVTSFIKSNDLIIEKVPIVIGVSGGSDSVALTHLLFNIYKMEAFGCPLYIAHLNHQLRGAESDKDSEYVRNIARQLGLPVLIKDIDIKRISEESSSSIEEAARIERYKFLEDCANEVDAHHVAVAHTADDNIETLLQRIIRGTGIRGLCSISAKRLISPGSNITLIRPFLEIWKEDILEYLERKDISYRVDSSNLQKDHLRNKIRLELLPMLEKEYNNQIKRTLSNLCEISKQSYKLIEDLSLPLANNAILEKGNNKYILDNKILRKSPEIVQQKVVHDIFSNLGLPLKDVGYQKYKNVIELIKKGKNNETLYLSESLIIRKIEEKLFIEILGKDQLSKIESDEYRAALIEKFGEIKLAVPGMTILPIIDSSIETKAIQYEKGFLESFKAGKTTNEEAIDTSKVDLPLYVRLRRQGDRFWPIGANGTKKIKDFLIDVKTSKYERDRIPIVMSKHSPIWVVGLRLDNRVKITKTTKNIIILKYLTKP